MESKKTISVCIIGKPNAGKSSLLNSMLGQKLSIVTPKVQTTRSIITGIAIHKDTQIILLDTPGIFEPKRQLEKAMVRCAWSSLNEADIVLLVIDSTKVVDDFTKQILKRLSQLKLLPIFLINKIDLRSTKVKAIEETIKEHFEAASIFKISALTGENLDNLLNYISSVAKPSAWLYGEDDITTLPMRFLASEVTREQLFLTLHEELPYNLTVQTERWLDNPDGSVKINQVIVVSKQNYKAMILGKHGAKIKEIGTKARQEIEKMLDIKAHLFLFVKVREEWESKPEFYSEMRLKFTM